MGPDRPDALQAGVADAPGVRAMRSRNGGVGYERHARQPRFGVPAAQMAERPARERLVSDLIAGQRFDRNHIHALPGGWQPPGTALEKNAQLSDIRAVLRGNGLFGQGRESDRLVALMAEMVAEVDWLQAGPTIDWSSLNTMLQVADAAASVD